MIDVGRSKRAQQAFAFDDITIVPSRRTRGERRSRCNGGSTRTPSHSRCSRRRWTQSCRRPRPSRSAN